MFIGRKNELDSLNKLYNSTAFQCAIVYGRRRIGKTFLLMEFVRDKDHVYYAAEEYSPKVLLDKFSKTVLEKFPSEYIRSFDSFESAVSYLGEKAREKRLILIIDEFQFWAEQEKGILSSLQNLIDHQLVNTRLFLILCGSYVGFMEKEVLGYKSPLYGRRTAQYKIEPFDYRDASLFHPEYSPEDRLTTYAILGGVPQYLKCFDPGFSVRDNVIERVVAKNSFLHDEPKFFLRQELKEPSNYYSIIEAIAKGYTKYNEISTKIGFDCGFYLNTLIELHIISRQLPSGEKRSSRKSVYSLNDNLFRFWFRFLADASIFIEQGLYENVYDKIIQPGLSNYISHVFENTCIQYMKRVNAKGILPFTFLHAGKWWGNNRMAKRQEEIDILAVDDNSNALFGECKWRNDPLDVKVVYDLIEKSTGFDYKNKFYILFSKSGFTKAVEDYAKENGLILKSLDDMYNSL